MKILRNSIKYVVFTGVILSGVQLSADWQRIGGETQDFKTITVGPKGRVYALGFEKDKLKSGKAYAWTGSAWKLMGSEDDSFRTLIIGLDGTVYSFAHYKDKQRRHYVYKWTGSKWQQLGGDNAKLRRIEIAPDGTLFGLKVGGKICKWTGSAWETLGTERFSKITVSAGGEIYAIQRGKNKNVFFYELARNKSRRSKS